MLLRFGVWGWFERVARVGAGDGGRIAHPTLAVYVHVREMYKKADRLWRQRWSMILT